MERPKRLNFNFMQNHRELQIMMEQLVPEARYAYYRRCQQFRRNGQQCKAPAVKGESICHKHAEQATTEDRRARQRRELLSRHGLGFGDFKAIQRTISAVMQALLDGSMDTKTAGRLIIEIQTASKLLWQQHLLHQPRHKATPRKEEPRKADKRSFRPCRKPARLRLFAPLALRRFRPAFGNQLAQPLLQQLERVRQALNAVRLPNDAFVVDVAAQVLHQLAEPAQAFRGQTRKHCLRVLTGPARVHEFVDGPGSHANIVQRLAKFPEQRSGGGLPGLEVHVQCPQFSGKVTQLGRERSCVYVRHEPETLAPVKVNSGFRNLYKKKAASGFAKDRAGPSLTKIVYDDHYVASVLEVPAHPRMVH